MKQEKRIYKYDAVSFELNDETQFGWVADLRGKFASVELENRTVYRVWNDSLRRLPWTQRRALHTEREYLQFVFLPKDEVEFSHDGEVLHGSISNLANKRAAVTLADGGTWKVPYQKIRLASNHDTTIRDRKKKLEKLAARSVEELRKHILEDWIFRFDNSISRVGVCKHARKLIALSNIHCLENDAEGVWDTVLHEIAHALVDPKAGHGPEWVKQAKALGCTAKVRADEAVERTRYIQTCVTCKWGRRMQRRSRNRRCIRCGRPVTYQNYTEEAWQRVLDSSLDK